MTEREFDKIREQFKALSQDEATAFLAKLAHENGLDTGEIDEIVTGMQQQTNMEAEQ